MTSDFEPNSEDQQILDITRKLCKTLEVNFVAKEVLWQDTVPMGRGSLLMPSDQCLFDRGRVILARRMQKKLQPDEWTPLIASSLVYQKKIEPKMKRQFLARIIVPGIIPLLGALPLSYFVSNQFIRLGYLVLSGVILVSLLRLYMPLLKKGKLEADAKIAGRFGKETFIQVLKKIDSMKLNDIEVLKAGGRSAAQFADRPSITERMQNLQTAETLPEHDLRH